MRQALGALSHLVGGKCGELATASLWATRRTGDGSGYDVTFPPLKSMSGGLPAIYPFRFFTTDGCSVSYGIDQIEAVRGAASYVDRILRGANPGELPVQLPTKYWLVMNLKTADALGLAIPQSLLLRAEEVI